VRYIAVVEWGPTCYADIPAILGNWRGIGRSGIIFSVIGLDLDAHSLLLHFVAPKWKHLVVPEVSDSVELAL
jgi:hypothetical protein